jgi:hypothetical protein
MKARALFRVWIRAVFALLALSTIPACIPPLEQTQPLIVLDPARGGPGTAVAVSGSGFPAATRVSVRLGPPSVGATPLSYGDAEADASGCFALSFTLPSHWPDGTPLAESELVVVVLNQDGSIKATAAFDYLLSSATILAPALGVQEIRGERILAWHRESSADGFCGDVEVYESGYVEIAWCKSAGSIERRQLSQKAIDQLQAWVATYQAFEIEQIQGTGPGQVRTRTTFLGKGARPVSEVELRMIQALLETLAPSS